MVQQKDITAGLELLLKNNTPVTLMSSTGEVVMKDAALEFESDLYGNGVSIGYYVGGVHLNTAAIKSHTPDGIIVLKDRYLNNFRKEVLAA